LAKASPPAVGQVPAILRITLRDTYGKDLAVGNGFFVDSRGIVVTAHHLVAHWVDVPQHTLMLVTEKGENLSPDDVIALDERRGVAILRVRGEGFPSVKFTHKHRTGKGDVVVSFDRRGGVSAIPVQGIVEEVRSGDGFLRISTSLPAMNEGSPVFGANGELAGVAVVTGVAQKGKAVTIAAPVRYLSETVEAWREFERGRAHGEAEKHKDALGAFKRAIQLRPDYAEAHYALGVTLSRLGSYIEALDAYADAVRLMPHHRNARLYLGKTYTVLGKHDEAIETYLKLLELVPDNVEAYALLGYSYQEKGMNHSAIKAYEEAIIINPGYVDAYLMLGGLYVKFGNYEEALKAWKRAVEVSPEHAEARFRLGVLYLALGDGEAAMAEYRKLNELDREMAETLRTQIESRER
jgi:tetratricopeptide (TPR) repeat protein